ncbi:MAG: hypothetical protein JWM44_2618 [Bacilli bacterium]|nr:hypothetical protein [Bacilli bacterium]
MKLGAILIISLAIIISGCTGVKKPDVNFRTILQIENKEFKSGEKITYTTGLENVSSAPIKISHAIPLGYVEVFDMNNKIILHKPDMTFDSSIEETVKQKEINSYDVKNNSANMFFSLDKVQKYKVVATSVFTIHDTNGGNDKKAEVKSDPVIIEIKER